MLSRSSGSFGKSFWRRMPRKMKNRKRNWTLSVDSSSAWCWNFLSCSLPSHFKVRPFIFISLTELQLTTLLSGLSSINRWCWLGSCSLLRAIFGTAGRSGSPFTYTPLLQRCIRRLPLGHPMPPVVAEQSYWRKTLLSGESVSSVCISLVLTYPMF